MGLWVSTPTGLTTSDLVTITSNADDALTVSGGVTSNGVFTSTRNENAISRHTLTNSNVGNGAGVLVDFANDLGIRAELGILGSGYSNPLLADTAVLLSTSNGGIRFTSNNAVVRLLSNGQIGVGTDAPLLSSALDIMASSALGNGLVLLRPSAATQLMQLLVSPEDVAVTSSGVNIVAGGSSASGTIFNVALADIGLVQFQGVANAVIGTNNSIPLRFGTAGVERWQITASGHLTPSVTASYSLGDPTHAMTAVHVFPPSGTGGYFMNSLDGVNKLRWYLMNTNSGINRCSWLAVDYLTAMPGIVSGQQNPFIGLGVNEIGSGEDDWGNAVPGGQLFLGRNTNGAGAPGCLTFRYKNGSNSSVWVDTAGDFRIRPNASGPNPGDADTIGTVIGTQTSTRDSKEAIEPRTDYDAMLDAVIKAPLFNWRYKSGSCGGQVFTGLTIDDTPWSGMDPDDDHPHGRSFNPLTVSGYLIGAIKALEDRLRMVEEQCLKN